MSRALLDEHSARPHLGGAVGVGRTGEHARGLAASTAASLSRAEEYPVLGGVGLGSKEHPVVEEDQYTVERLLGRRRAGEDAADHGARNGGGCHALDWGLPAEPVGQLVDFGIDIVERGYLSCACGIGYVLEGHSSRRGRAFENEGISRRPFELRVDDVVCAAAVVEFEFSVGKFRAGHSGMMCFVFGCMLHCDILISRSYLRQSTWFFKSLMLPMRKGISSR